jgi:carotenoid cleavage oxygenase
MSINRYLEGDYAPIATEYTSTDLEITGTIPDFLDGRYLRNGPNPVGELDPASYHWFMGAGMVHGVRLRDGRAEWYRNRWIRSPYVARTLGEPTRSHDDRAGVARIAANTNAIGHAGKTLALVEGGAACYELTDALDTVGPCTFDGTLPGGYTAHPKRDPDTGELHAVTHFFSWGNNVRYSVIGADGRARRVVDIPVTGSPMMHDISITEKHVIFYDLPLTFDVKQAAAVARIPGPLRYPTQLVLSTLIGRVRIPNPMSKRLARLLPENSVLPYHWNPDYPARVGVMPRDGDASDVRWFDVEPCMVFHPLNAYDTDDGVVLDVVRHPSMMESDLHGADEGPATLDRWTVDFSSGKVREERLDDHGQEFPRVDERLVGKPHRYGYAPHCPSGARPEAGLLKHDLTTRTSILHDFGAGTEASEFVFHPRSDDAAEDDGVVMGYVYDKADDRSSLTILDAATLDTVAQIHLPTRVPHGFHGNWIPTGQ